MSTSGSDGTGDRDLGAQRWGAEKDEIDHLAQEEHLAHEAERVHAEETLEEGRPVARKRPWWKFWAGG